jgi:hypothetical protein
MPRWSATDRMKRRDVAGHRGSGESANKFYSEGAHLSSCWEIPQARTAARVKLPLGVNRIILVGGRLSSGLPPETDIVRVGRHVSKVPILLQKSFWGDVRNFLEPLMRFTSGDVRDHIVSSKIDQ